ncbi:hydrogenase nickel incorporation protein HypB [Candidatus Synechococcus spongiarum]|uniref:[NiFe] hydrogenase nickel incorporation-associated protein HypB n=1 Tax=Candidatus Synechococcus spongiarum TaxID=431041 RepID=A0A165B2Q0_9SYNE|nr:hydrogenase nickel incorporation protein HypB [Candidatus Synechococcus spongiarum]SAY38933.1 [NiFe] hydrogenase nickel incorporation-associated protein HypB [Candidatus Synechococcus spongiarum]
MHMPISDTVNLLAANDRQARHNCQHFDNWGLFCINVMSSPGAGKTVLLEKALHALHGKQAMAVLEGDMTTQLDAQRLAGLGVPVVPITMGRACYLDAAMVSTGLQLLREQCDLASLDLLWVENVGNLVCPAEFAIGEHCKLALLSVTEGDDKPLKYPVMLREADCVLVTKVDLLPHVPADPERMGHHIRQINSHCGLFPVSALTGAGLGDWLVWLGQQLRAKGRHHRNPQRPASDQKPSALTTT